MAMVSWLTLMLMKLKANAKIEEVRQKKRKILNLSHHSLTTVPSSLANSDELANYLESLNLDRNLITQLPLNFFLLFRRLKNLSLTHNQLTSFPTIIPLNSLLYLNISGNDFSQTGFPLSLCHLTQLKFLWANDIHIHTLPPQISQLKNLHTLGLRHNHLTTLPSSIIQLQSLVWLTCDNNLIHEIPVQVFSLPLLKHLNFSRNRISSLPPKFFSLKLLRYLFLRNNLLMVSDNMIRNIQCAPRLKYADLSFNPTSSSHPFVGSITLDTPTPNMTVETLWENEEMKRRPAGDPWPPSTGQLMMSQNTDGNEVSSSHPVCSSIIYFELQDVSTNTSRGFVASTRNNNGMIKLGIGSKSNTIILPSIQNPSPFNESTKGYEKNLSLIPDDPPWSTETVTNSSSNNIQFHNFNQNPITSRTEEVQTSILGLVGRKIRRGGSAEQSMICRQCGIRQNLTKVNSTIGRTSISLDEIQYLENLPRIQVQRSRCCEEEGEGILRQDESEDEDLQSWRIKTRLRGSQNEVGHDRLGNQKFEMESHCEDSDLERRSITNVDDEEEEGISSDFEDSSDVDNEEDDEEEEDSLSLENSVSTDELFSHYVPDEEEGGGEDHVNDLPLDRSDVTFLARIVTST